MQIDKLILYSKVGEVRELPFSLGKVNIISGESKSGKSAIVGIIDYCLGSKSCEISEGKIRNTVNYFALIVQFDDGERSFIARQNPNIKDVSSISSICLQRNIGSSIPHLDELVENFNIDSLKGYLSTKIGISENVHTPEELTHEPLVANFKHSRFYCYQPQFLIADPHQLFFNQNKDFVPQSIKDTLPYFLGAINEFGLSIEGEITKLKRELNKLVREKRERNRIETEGINQAFALISEAKEIGIYKGEDVPSSNEIAFEVLRKISIWEYEPLQPKGDDNAIKLLIEQRQVLATELGKLEDNLKAANDFTQASLEFNGELKQQEIRLSSINIIPNSEGKDNSNCPLCDSNLNTPVPVISQIEKSLQSIRQDLRTTSVEKPRLQSHISTLNDEANKVRDALRNVEQSINALYKESQEARSLRDLNIRRGRVIGRVSLFLESGSNTEQSDDIESEIERLKTEIASLEKQVDTESEKEKLLSIMNKINLQMSRWVSRLDVEYENAPIRFDLGRLTVFVDTEQKSIALPQVGSGANWVAYHLLVLLGLHHHFVQKSRPVPRFLVLDQPTQVYYPPDKESGLVEVSSDHIAVNKMFDFIFDVVESLTPKFQVIITDHAYLTTERFKDSIVEIWRSGQKLIPEHWGE